MRNSVYWIWTMICTDPFIARFYVEPRVVSRPIVLRNHQLTNPMHAHENPIPGSREIIYSIDLNRWQRKNLLIYRSTGNHE